MSAMTTAPANDRETSVRLLEGGQQFVSFLIDEELFGVPVSMVQEVLNPQRIAATPLARPEIAGLLNLRGQIVTAFNLRRRLGLKDAADGQQCMNIVVRFRGESFSLLVDNVGDVITFNDARMEPPPRTLDPKVRALVAGVYRLESQLIVILDLEQLLLLDRDRGAAGLARRN